MTAVYNVRCDKYYMGNLFSGQKVSILFSHDVQWISIICIMMLMCEFMFCVLPGGKLLVCKNLWLFASEKSEVIDVAYEFYFT